MERFAGAEKAGSLPQLFKIREEDGRTHGKGSRILETAAFEKYPGYKFIDAEVYVNGVNGGYYIYARMVRD